MIYFSKVLYKKSKDILSIYLDLSFFISLLRSKYSQYLL